MIILIIVTCRIDEHTPMRKWKETKKEKEKEKKGVSIFCPKKLVLKSIQRGLPGTRIQFKPRSCLTAREFGLRDFHHKSFEGQFTC